ncbi:ATP-binding cassette domain-containing protein [Sphingomonas sp.]|uniref:ATP-binding cassette domain-containing protein n=1 Tax=Sphingomonas sp. TaxID=28214 RepID=UPI003B0021B9
MGFDVDVEVALGGRTIAARFAGEQGVTVLFGRSGAGKTTALDMVAGLRRPARGHVRVGGETLFDAARRIDLPPERRRLGYVFQDVRLFPHRRVRANLLYGHRLARVEDRWLAPEEAIALLGLDGLLDRWPRTLSGGEQRRVAIGRALLAGARALLMDEPLSSLDRARREEVMVAIERVRDALALPILYVTHDADEAERLATRIVAIE